MMSELSEADFRWAVQAAIIERKLRMPRRERISTLIIDDMLDEFGGGVLCPTLVRFKPSGFDPTDARRRQLCAETREMIERLAPVVRVLAERG